MTTDKNSPYYEMKIERRTMADGTVQVTCANEHCYNGGWFDVAPTGRPARFCSTNCRVAQHRLVKTRRENEARRIEREEWLARMKAEHQARWVSFLMENTPDNGRMTEAACQRLYESMLGAEMIDGPFVQLRMF